MKYSIPPGWKWIDNKEATLLFKKLNLLPQHRLLLLSDGSLTQFLEVLNQSPVDVEIKNHEIRTIEKGDAEYLEVAAGQEAIVRDVWLIQDGGKLVYAHSVFPMAGHDRNLLERISTSIEPLGKSLTDQGLLTSKDKIEISAVQCRDVNDTLNLKQETILWAKHYRLQAQQTAESKGIVASITEIFSPNLIAILPKGKMRLKP